MTLRFTALTSGPTSIRKRRQDLPTYRPFRRSSTHMSIMLLSPWLASSMMSCAKGWTTSGGNWSWKIVFSNFLEISAIVWYWGGVKGRGEMSTGGEGGGRARDIDRSPECSSAIAEWNRQGLCQETVSSEGGGVGGGAATVLPREVPSEILHNQFPLVYLSFSDSVDRQRCMQRWLAPLWGGAAQTHAIGRDRYCTFSNRQCFGIPAFGVVTNWRFGLLPDRSRLTRTTLEFKVSFGGAQRWRSCIHVCFCSLVVI